MLYEGITILLASKHKKEEAVTSAFKRILNCDLWAPNDFDTDQFGTFTGEIERVGTQYETLLMKAKAAAEKYGFRHVIASEGSFGPHPKLYFLPGSVEMLAFVDLVENLIIVESQVSEETNYAQLDLDNPKIPEDFLLKVGFPQHALIVRRIDNNQLIAKAIQDRKHLLKALTLGLKKGSKIRLETDMRAHLNPTRMKTLRPLAEQLAKRVATQCPACQTPGFGKITLYGHLPCEACGTPTELYQNKILSCLRCDFKSFLSREDGLVSSSQQYCRHCNP